MTGKFSSRGTIWEGGEFLRGHNLLRVGELPSQKGLITMDLACEADDRVPKSIVFAAVER